MQASRKREAAAAWRAGPEARRPGAGRRPRRAIAAVAFAALAAALALPSCSASVGARLGADGGARLTVSARVPAELSARLRALGSLPAGSPLFDRGAVARSASAMPGLRLLSLETADGDSIAAEFEIADLAAFAERRGLAKSGAVAYVRGAARSELRLRVDRKGARGLAEIFPGLDPALLDALAPPALGEEELTKAEYREMLGSLVGTKNLPALDATRVEIRLRAPGPVLASSGGKLTGNELAASLPLLDLLVLEEPVEFHLAWRN